MGNGIFLLIVFAALCMAFFIFLCARFYMLLAPATVSYGYASNYLSIYLNGTLLVQIVLGMNSYIITQGRSIHTMVSIVVDAITYIVLDPVSIFVLNMGVKGAAIATVISQLFSALCTIFVL